MCSLRTDILWICRSLFFILWKARSDVWGRTVLYVHVPYLLRNEKVRMRERVSSNLAPSRSARRPAVLSPPHARDLSQLPPKYTRAYYSGTAYHENFRVWCERRSIFDSDWVRCLHYWIGAFYDLARDTEVNEWSHQGCLNAYNDPERLGDFTLCANKEDLILDDDTDLQKCGWFGRKYTG